MTDQPTPETEPEDLTGAWEPAPPIGCLLPGAAPDAPPMAAGDLCEHHYETRILGGHPITVRACVFCRTPDWNDLREQADELYRWGWQEGRAGKPARGRLSAYDKPPQAPDGPTDGQDAHGGSQGSQEGSLRDKIAEALMRWAEGNNNPRFAPMRRPGTVVQNAYSRADAVLAVVQPELAALARVRAWGQSAVDAGDTGPGVGIGRLLLHLLDGEVTP
ncbi:hypothetical protein [Streptomyces sp.]|uniref:hypothetical protein n=1 Tax=Streptomyces sp. TaxID=1931 RepID=UPI002F938CAB